MGLEILRMMVKTSAVLFFLGGGIYFFFPDNWLSNHTKMAGILLVSLLLVMIGGIIGIMMIMAMS